MINYIPVSQLQIGDTVEYSKGKFSKLKAVRHFKGVGGQSVTLWLRNKERISHPLHGEIRIKI